MLSDLKISGFRSFPVLQVERLARVNLFVGSNNAGKTSLLDGVEILLGGGAPRSLWRSTQRRREILVPSADDAGRELDPSHLFYGHILDAGTHVTLEGHENSQQRRVSIAIIVMPLDGIAETGQASLPLTFEPTVTEIPLAITIRSDRFDKELVIPLSASKGISTGSLDYRRRSAGFDVEAPVTSLMGTESIDTAKLAQFWDTIILTPEESKVKDSLRIIEPTVERIAATTVGRSSAVFFIKSSESEQRVPLGSMGEGMTRLLALSLHLASSTGRYLLVDEIDTGLHYSVMTKMWRLVAETARRLEIQVFATTHSLDCLRALAWLYADSPDIGPDILVHRIEKNRPTTTLYTADEILTAVEHEMEIR